MAERLIRIGIPEDQFSEVEARERDLDWLGKKLNDDVVEDVVVLLTRAGAIDVADRVQVEFKACKGVRSEDLGRPIVVLDMSEKDSMEFYYYERPKFENVN